MPDVLVPDNISLVKSAGAKSGYIFDLDADKICRLIYFFGSRKFSSKALGRGGSKTSQFTSMEKTALKYFFDWFGLIWSDDHYEFSKSYTMLTVRFRQVLDFLKKRPAFVTRDVYNACKHCGYPKVVDAVVFVIDENRNIVPRTVTPTKGQETVPIGQAESLMWNIQNIALDKMLLVLQSITPKDIRRANLGMKSKSLRDIYSMYHMSKLNNKNPNMTLINLNISSSEPSQKTMAYQNYIQRNRSN